MSSLEKSTTNTGYIVGSKDGELLRVDTDTHLISIARTGGGKGKTVAIPNLLDHEGSVLSLEIDGETLLATEFYRRNILKQQIRILDPFHATEAPERDSINILDTLDPSSPLFSADAKIVAKSIVKTDSGAESPDPYWTNKSVELLTSLIIYAKIDPRVAEEDRNLSFVASIVSSFGSEEWEMHMLRLTSDTSIFKNLLKGAGSYFYNSSGPIMNSNTSSIISVLSGYMDFARDPQIQRYSDHSTFALNELAEGNTTVYIVMPSVDYFTAFNTWVRLLVERTIAVVPSRTGKKHLIKKENRILFMLDEFTQLGKLDGVDQGMQTCRHKGITLWLLFQDLSRLRLVYGNEVAESFLGAASCIQAFEITERETTKYLSERTGKRVIYIANTSLSESLGDSDTLTKSTAHSSSDSTSVAERIGFTKGGGTSNSYADNALNSNPTTANSTNWQTSEDSTVTKSSGNSVTDQFGTSQTRTQTRNLGVCYQGHIVPALEATDIMKLTSSTNMQILAFYDGEVLISERADWLSLPQLRERVEGPRPPLLSDFPSSCRLTAVDIKNNKTVYDLLNQVCSVFDSANELIALPGLPRFPNIISYTTDFNLRDGGSRRLTLFAVEDLIDSLKNRTDCVAIDTFRLLEKQRKRFIAKIVSDIYEIFDSSIVAPAVTQKAMSLKNANIMLEATSLIRQTITSTHSFLSEINKDIEISRDNIESLASYHKHCDAYTSQIEKFMVDLQCYCLARQYWPNLPSPGQPNLSNFSYHNPPIDCSAELDKISAEVLRLQTSVFPVFEAESLHPIIFEGDDNDFYNKCKQLHNYCTEILGRMANDVQSVSEEISCKIDRWHEFYINWPKFLVREKEPGPEDYPFKGNISAELIGTTDFRGDIPKVKLELKARLETILSRRFWKAVDAETHFYRHLSYVNPNTKMLIIRSAVTAHTYRDPDKLVERLAESLHRQIRNEISDHVRSYDSLILKWTVAIERQLDRIRAVNLFLLYLNKMLHLRYLHDRHSVSAQNGLIQDKLAELVGMPIWQRLREQEEADLTGNGYRGSP